MSIPDYQSIMLPLLKFAGDGKDHSLHEAIDYLAEIFSLSPEELSALLPSGQQPIFTNRIGWARTYLTKAGLLEHVKRGVFHISPTGLDILKSNPTSINVAFLERFPSFIEFREAHRKPKAEPTGIPGVPANDQETPEETLERAYIGIREALAQEILLRVSKSSPEFFERLVVELLVKMGYGGTRQDAGERIGQSGDGGIDGIIKEDRLGLDVIYIQAKRWQGSVGRPEIQKFVGALQGQRARKGVFLTTSTFTLDAKEYASRIDNKVVLIDGTSLANYMIDFDLGVSAIAAYSIKRIDSDYFEEE